MPYVYRHIRLDTNQPFYIGIGSIDKHKRAYEVQKRNKHWNNVVNKTSWSVDILFDDISWEEAGEKEIEFIKLYGRKVDGGLLVNVTIGGGGTTGTRHTKESKEKISFESKNRIRHPRSEETKLKLRIANLGKVGANLGRKWTDDMKKKLSNTLTGRVGHNLGRKWSDETKRKISIAKTGIPSKKIGIKLTDECKNKISETVKSLYKNGFICTTSKLVLDTKTGIYYDSCIDASRTLGIKKLYEKLGGKRKNTTSLIYC